MQVDFEEDADGSLAPKLIGSSSPPATATASTASASSFSSSGSTAASSAAGAAGASQPPPVELCRLGCGQPRQ
eukprot:6336524-Alexandrium_andersonii.AAC.1